MADAGPGSTEARSSWPASTRRAPRSPCASRSRRDPERLYGEAVGQRAGLVSLEYALRSLRSIRRLRRIPLGVVLCTDQAQGSPHSAEVIRAAAARASRVLVLEPSVSSSGVVLRRRGNRRYTLHVTGDSILPVQTTRKQATARWTIERLERIAQLTSRNRSVSVSILDLSTEAHALHLPHRVTAGLLVTYRDVAQAAEVDKEIRTILGRGGCRWELATDWDRPPMPETAGGAALQAALNNAGHPHGIEFKRETSSVASVAGLVGDATPCVCGVGPVAYERGTPGENIERITLIERTVVLAEFLAGELDG